MQIANSNPDPETAGLVREINKVITAKHYVDEFKSFVAHPTRWTGQKLKSHEVNAVFNHYRGALQNEMNSFVTRFPGVDEFTRDPLGTGVSLEEYREKYDKARMALNSPNFAKDLLYAGVAMTAQGKSDAATNAELQQADDLLAKLPGAGEFVRKFNKAQADYSLALAFLDRDVEALDEKLRVRSAEFVKELRRRSEALAKAKETLEDDARKLLPFVYFESVEFARSDLIELADGFGGLKDQVNEFADLVEARKQEYESALEGIAKESQRAGQGIGEALIH